MDQLNPPPALAVSVAEPLEEETVKLFSKDQMTSVIGKWPEAVPLPLKAGPGDRKFAAGEDMATRGAIASKIAVKAKPGAMMKDSVGVELLPLGPTHLLKVENGSGLAVTV